MKITPTKLSGVFLIENTIHKDNRGLFIKNFSKDIFLKHGISIVFEEIYYSVSNKNVIRGMHFQTPPHDHEKLVTVVTGKITDVVLDIRSDSRTYGEYIIVNLDSDKGQSIYIPRGFAHGFLSQSDGTTLLYLVSSVYNMHADEGVRYDSFGFDWNVKSPIISDRDLNLLAFGKKKYF